MKRVAKQEKHQRVVRKGGDVRSRPQEMIYSGQKKLETALRKASEDRINGNSILALYENTVSERSALLTRLAAVERLLVLSKLYGKPFSGLDKPEWGRLVLRLEKEGYSDWTIYGYSQSLRRLMKFFGREEEDYQYIKCKVKQASLKVKDLVSKDDFKRMLGKATTPRDKFFLSLLFETGMRIGEMLSLKIGNLQFDEHGIKVQLEGKTGSRTIRVVASHQSAVDYLRHHPDKDNQDSWLFLNSRNKMMKYSVSYETLKKLAEQAGLHKRIFHHLFRHSSASRYCRQMRESVMDSYFGWVVGSTMPKKYIHIDGDAEADRAILEIYGLAKKDKEEPAALKCPRCGIINMVGESMCRCGFIFSPATAAILQSERTDKVEELDRKYAQIEEKLKRLLKEP